MSHKVTSCLNKERRYDKWPWGKACLAPLGPITVGQTIHPHCNTNKHWDNNNKFNRWRYTLKIILLLPLTILHFLVTFLCLKVRSLSKCISGYLTANYIMSLWMKEMDGNELKGIHLLLMILVLEVKATFGSEYLKV